MGAIVPAFAVVLAGLATPGCAPMISIPPPVPLYPDGADEIGFAADISVHEHVDSNPAAYFWHRHALENVDVGPVVSVLLDPESALPTVGCNVFVHGRDDGDLSFAYGGETWGMFFFCNDPCPMVSVGAYAGARF